MIEPQAPQRFRDWVLQDWAANATRPESQLILAWFRMAQWSAGRWGNLARLVVTPYWLTCSLIFSVELPVTAKVGPRLRLYHPHGIVLSPHCTIGSDCHLRHNVTIGNRVDRDGNEIGVATVGDDVELGAGCAVVGDLHVGDHARIGALAVVVKSVPAWAVVVGNPGRVIRIDDPAGNASNAEADNLAGNASNAEADDLAGKSPDAEGDDPTVDALSAEAGDPPLGA